MVNHSKNKYLSATVSYHLTGLAFACPTLFAVGWVLPRLTNSNIVFSASLAIVHALVLGFMLTVAFGVLYQVVPIAFMAPQMPRHVLHWHLPVHIISVVLMIYGFLRFNMVIVAIGGGLLCAGAIAYLVILYAHFRKAKNKTYIHSSLYFPVISLIIVLFIGLWQASFPNTVSPRLLITHVIVGGLAFWGGLVLVVSYRFIPMFTLSHGYRATLSRIRWIYFGGLAIIIMGEWLVRRIPIISGIGEIILIAGSVCCGFGVVSFVIDVVRILNFRAKQRLVNPIREALAALACLVVGQLLLLVAIPFSSLKLALAAAYLFAFGGLVPLILAYMQKIIPFLWLQYRFSTSSDRMSAPMIDEMVPRQLSKFAIILYFIGAAIGLLLLLIVWLGHISNINFIIHLIPGSLMAISVTLLIVSLRRVLTIGGPRPPRPIED